MRPDSQIKTLRAKDARARAVSAASAQIAEAIRHVPYSKYQLNRLGQVHSDDSSADLFHVNEAQAPSATRQVAYYDRCTDFRASDSGRPCVISAGKDALWFHPRDHADHSNRESADSLQPKIRGRLNSRISACSGKKQTLQARLLAQVLRRRVYHLLRNVLYVFVCLYLYVSV
jgi:hypothetical protein